jgi:hypothetical protein
MRKYHAMKAYGGVEVNYAFLILALDENKWPCLHMASFTPKY